MLCVGYTRAIARVGRHVDQGREREGSFVQAWMWDDRRRIVGGRAVGPQQIEIDRARRVSLGPADPAELSLDGEQVLNERAGSDRCIELHQHRAVQERWLRRPADRVGLEQRGASHVARARQSAKPLHRRVDRGEPIAEVRAHADDDAHASLYSARVPATANFADPGALVIAALAVVGLLAGLVDAIAGGGGMLTLPALLAAGLPPHVALGTNKGCSTFGTAMATATFAHRGRLQLRRTLLGFAAGAFGAVLGARLQLAIDPKALRPIVLVLLIVVAVVLTVQRPRASQGEGASPTRSVALATAIGLTLGVYDGFFGPGTGTFLIVAQVGLLHATMSEATADAKPVNLGSNVASLVTFAARGTVLWKIAVPMALGNIVGGAIGARIAMHGGDRVVRFAVIAVSLALVAKLTWDLVQ